MSIIFIATVLIALSAAVASGELAARCWLRMCDSYYVRAPYERHEFGLHREVFPGFPSPARFIVNSEGERADEIPRRCPRLYRILVAGGSAPECLLLDQEASWPVLLQRILECPENLKLLAASHVHVGNIGKSEVGSEALAVILEMVLRRMKRLDAVIIMVGATDVFRWLQAGAPPIQVRAVTSSSDLTEYFAWLPLGSFRWRPRQSALAEIVRRIRQVVLRPTIYHKNSGKSQLRWRKMRSAALEARTAVQNAAVMVDNYEFFLRRAIDIARAKADRVIVARQPWLSKVDQLEWEHLWHGAVGDVTRCEVKVFYSSEVLSGLMGQIDERAAAVAQAMGVECCDLRRAIEPSFKSYYDLVHFAPAGSAAVARVLADLILCR